MERSNLSYKDIEQKVNAICMKNPECWHTPTEEVKCPYVSVCRAEYTGPNNGTSAFETAVVARYKELHGIAQGGNICAT